MCQMLNIWHISLTYQKNTSMTKEQIIAELASRHHDFVAYMQTLNQVDFEYAHPEKWSAGQQLMHIVRSVEPLAWAFRLPKFAFRMLYGKANRPSRNYDELVARYQEKITSGRGATGRFVPKPVFFAQKQALGTSLDRKVTTLTRLLGTFSEDDLDKLVAPHPLLGKITLREMMYFTIFHVDHHKALTQKYLTLRSSQ